MNPSDWPRQTPERMVRTSLHDPENMRELLSAVIPNLVNGFDFTRLKPLPLSFFGEDWREREADLLFEVPYLSDGGATSTLVCLLLEHQTNTDRLSALRSFIVSGAFWDRCWRAWRQSKPPRPSLMLPPIIPIVLYTGSTTWGSVTKLGELVDGPAELKRWIPDWGPEFWSLADRSLEELLNGGGWMQFMAVIRVEEADATEFERVFTAAVTHLAALRQTNQVRWFELLSIVFGYALFRRQEPQHQRLREIVQLAAPDRVEEVNRMSMTIAESLIFEGELRATRHDLRNVLEERFGELSEAWKQKIEATTDLERLRAAHNQSWKIGSLDELQL